MDLMHQLKVSTRDLHQKIEQTELFRKIISNEITLVEYMKLLSLLFGYIYPCEGIIQKHYLHLLLGREKSPLLISDLSALKDINQNTIFLCKDIPRLNVEEEVYGYLYVMEGSTLGGQVITNLLKKNKHIPCTVPTHYFNAYGKKTGRKWHEFSRLLEECNAHPEQQDNVINSTNNTFKTLLHWLETSNWGST